MVFSAAVNFRNLRNAIFFREMLCHTSHKEEDFFCGSQVVLARGLWEGFFGLQNPENSPKAKTSLAKEKQAFLLFQMMKNVLH